MLGNKLIGCFAGLAALYLTMLAGTLISQQMRAGEESFRKGKASAKAFECEKAIEYFSEAINANPKEPEYFLERAKCRRPRNANIVSPQNANIAANSSSRKPTKLTAEAVLAVADLDAAIKLAPDYFEAYLARAEVKGSFINPGDPSISEVLKDYDKAIELDSGNPEHKHSKARFLLDTARDEKAGLAIYASMLAEKPNDPEVILERANYFMRAKKYEQAIADFTILIDQKAEGDDWRWDRAYAYFELKKYTEALADLNGIIAEPSGDEKLLQKAEALRLRAEIYRAMKKTALARADEKLVKQIEAKVFGY